MLCLCGPFDENQRMVIGIPKEIKAQEHRVGLLPSAAYQLIQRGHQVVVEDRKSVV